MTGVSWCGFFSWVVDNALDMGIGIRYVVDDIVFIFTYTDALVCFFKHELNSMMMLYERY